MVRISVQRSKDSVGHCEDLMEEIWQVIPDFPNYEVSNFGQVAHIEGDYYIRPSTVNRTGALKVGLVKNNKQYTRGLSKLVAEAFVPGQDDIFDTPIQLDNDYYNCRADNLAWRPRWFAHRYRKQYRHILDRYRLGPVVEMDEEGVVVNAYSDLVEVAMVNGLLLEDLWEGVNLKEPVFPHWRTFAFADKV